MALRTMSFATTALSDNAGLRAALWTSNLFAQLRERLRKVEVDGETYFVAEGDTLLDEDQLAFYAAAREKQDEAFHSYLAASRAGLGVTPLTSAPAAALLGMTHNGKVVRWAPNFVLTYRVARDTFTSSDRYDLAADCVRKATEAWENTCGIKFQYRNDLDNQPGAGPGGAVFSVREFNADGSFIASAFFPNDPPSRRRVLIDPSFYDDNLGFDRIGVLRHELGHVLGFRHEHIRSGAPPLCPHEDLDDVIDLTKYDPQSVMHYFCGGGGSRDLKITEIDRQGAQKVYGPPLNQTEFITS